MLIETDEYIDAAEAARMLGIKRARMSQLCTEGRFAGMVRIGHFWILPRKAVQNFRRLPPGVKAKQETSAEIKPRVSPPLEV